MEVAARGGQTSHDCAGVQKHTRPAPLVSQPSSPSGGYLRVPKNDKYLRGSGQPSVVGVEEAIHRGCASTMQAPYLHAIAGNTVVNALELYSPHLCKAPWVIPTSREARRAHGGTAPPAERPPLPQPARERAPRRSLGTPFCGRCVGLGPVLPCAGSSSAGTGGTWGSVSLWLVLRVLPDPPQPTAASRCHVLWHRSSTRALGAEV